MDQQLPNPGVHHSLLGNFEKKIHISGELSAIWSDSLSLEWNLRNL